MAQPMTALLEPEDQNMPACPNFCNGTCSTWVDADGSNHHSSGLSTVVIAGGYRGEDVDLDVSASLTDEDYQAGTPEVNLMPSRGGDGVTMAPAEARKLAALLLNAADDADPLPTGVVLTTASKLRLDDELLTDDGWQAVTGLMFFKPSQVSVFTTEHDDEDTDGIQLAPTDPVKVRRAVHDSCAIAFVEPIR